MHGPQKQDNVSSQARVAEGFQIALYADDVHQEATFLVRCSGCYFPWGTREYLFLQRESISKLE